MIFSKLPKQNFERWQNIFLLIHIRSQINIHSNAIFYYSTHTGSIRNQIRCALMVCRGTGRDHIARNVIILICRLSGFVAQHKYSFVDHLRHINLERNLIEYIAIIKSSQYDIWDHVVGLNYIIIIFGICVSRILNSFLVLHE